MTNKRTSNILFSLIRITLGKEATLSESLPISEWKAVAEFALKQSVLGVLLPAIESLNNEKKLPLGIYSLWMLAAEEQRERYSMMKDHAASLAGQLNAEGLRCCVLKGAGLAAFYPEPALRQSGDIDIWVEGGYAKVLPYLRGKYKIKDLCYHHCEARIFKEVPVEVHFTPTWFNSFPKDRKLQKWFAAQADKQFGNFIPELGFAVPLRSFNAIHSFVHILRHLLFEGVGLRQIMDMYYILSALSDEERGEVVEFVSEFGLERFSGALMFVLGDVFGLERERMLCEPDEVLGKRFLEEVMVAGNFGRYDSRNKIKEGDSVAKKAVLRLSRLTRYFVFCPSEILWAPLFKIWQYFWKKFLSRQA